MTKDTMKKEYTFKVTLLGPSQSGKTQIINRICHKEYKEHDESTIGAHFSPSIFSYPDKTVKLELWDTAGQARYKSLWPMFTKGAHIILIACDLSQDSFQAEAQSILKMPSSIPDNATVYLVGTKLDLVVNSSEREAKEDTLKKLAEANHCHTALTSAKENMGIEDLFNNAIEQKLKQLVDKEKQSTHSNEHPKAAAKQKRNLAAFKKHIKKHWKLYTISFLLALGVAAVLTVPGIGFAFGLSAALGYALVSTALQLGLVATGAGLITFGLALFISFKIADFQSKRKDYKRIEKDVPFIPSNSYTQVPPEAAAPTPTIEPANILDTPITPSPIGTAVTGQQVGMGSDSNTHSNTKQPS